MTDQCPKCGSTNSNHGSTICNVTPDEVKYTKAEWEKIYPPEPDEELDLATPRERKLIDEMYTKRAAKEAVQAANRIREATGQEQIPPLEEDRDANHQTVGAPIASESQHGWHGASHETAAFRIPGIDIHKIRIMLASMLNTPQTEWTHTEAGTIELLIRHLAIDLLDSEEFQSAVIAQATQLVSTAFPAFLETPMFKEAVTTQTSDAVGKVCPHLFRVGVFEILEQCGLIKSSSEPMINKQQDPELESNHFHTLCSKIDTLNQRIIDDVERTIVISDRLKLIENQLSKQPPEEIIEIDADGKVSSLGRKAEQDRLTVLSMKLDELRLTTQAISDAQDTFADAVHKKIATLGSATKLNAEAIEAKVDKLEESQEAIATILTENFDNTWVSIESLHNELGKVGKAGKNNTHSLGMKVDVTDQKLELIRVLLEALPAGFKEITDGLNTQHEDLREGITLTGEATAAILGDLKNRLESLVNSQTTFTETINEKFKEYCDQRAPKPTLPPGFPVSGE